jgi:alanyl-tRNA synthetase
MSRARETSKASWKGGGVTANETHLIEFVQKQKKTKFTGYKGTEGSGKVVALSDGSHTVASLKEGQSGVVVLDSTSFYAESGGQIGDKGDFKTKNLEAEVTNTTKMNDVFLSSLCDRDQRRT